MQLFGTTGGSWSCTTGGGFNILSLSLSPWPFPSSFSSISLFSSSLLHAQKDPGKIKNYRWNSVGNL